MRVRLCRERFTDEKKECSFFDSEIRSCGGPANLSLYMQLRTYRCEALHTVFVLLELESYVPVKHFTKVASSLSLSSTL